MKIYTQRTHVNGIARQGLPKLLDFVNLQLTHDIYTQISVKGPFIPLPAIPRSQFVAPDILYFRFPGP